MPPSSSLFADWQFEYDFRKYQRLILAQVESSAADDTRYHIVAPPGAGKTIVGLELIRQFGEPAVVFAPTTTIQAQWKDKANMFLTSPDQVNHFVGLEGADLHPVNIFTYQFISTAGKSRGYVQDMALELWHDELLQSGVVPNERAAGKRIQELKTNNPKDYRNELSRRYRRVKRSLLREPDVDIAEFLHPNAIDLIHKMVDYGIKTIVLDECHHLLDYWAIVLRYLISQIDDVRVVGLTATLPNPENQNAYENYTSILGDVDFEVPTPAVVKEGDLAPYRDLAYFVEPTRREKQYLKHIDAVFDQVATSLTQNEVFFHWLEDQVFGNLKQYGGTLAWKDFLYQRPLFTLAALRYLNHIQYEIPPELNLPRETFDPLELDDWAILLEEFGLKYLRVSPDEADHQRFRELRKALQPLGFTLTERGLRHTRSPGDLVLSFSEAKDHAVGHILKVEYEHMGPDLRAVVVTDFEKMSSGVARLDGVLDRNAGSARRLFHHLVTHPVAGNLEPVMVTGKTLLVDADHGDALINRFNEYLQENGFKASCHYQATDDPAVLEVVGEGRDWSSRTYVHMVTTEFERGVTKCLVGTRGIFGEGWDSLGLNTLVDLTSVTTSTSVQQLRGRSTRLDPNSPRKVAHNWDVVCIAPDFKKGDMDLQRFVKRHSRYWGIVTRDAIWDILDDALEAGTTQMAGGEWGLAGGLRDRYIGQIMKGAMHVHPDLPFDLALRGFKRVNFGKYTRYMLKQVDKRDKVYDYWGIGDEYQNFTYSASRLDVFDLKIRTVYSVQDTLKRLLRKFTASFIGGLLTVLMYACRISLSIESTEGAGMGFLVVWLIGLAGVFFMNLRAAIELAQYLLIEQPKDTILLDVGYALLAALQDAGLVSKHLQPEYVRVAELPDQSYQVLLDYASPEDADTFVRAYRDIFSDVRDQRYLIWQDETDLPNIWLRPLWAFIRAWMRDQMWYDPAYYPVPDVLATNKKRAESFAIHWEQYVGGGELVFTRSELGRALLLEARAQHRPDVKNVAFEIWR